MEKINGKVQGRGYFRKTKAYGLASGIILGATLILGANAVSADEVTPNQPATTEVSANAKPAEATLSENAANVKPAQESSDDPTNFRNREIVNKVENTQTPSNEPNSEGVYNSQIKSVESLTPEKHEFSDAYKYRMILHDGYTIPANGKITFYGSNSTSVAAENLYIGDENVGTITKESVITKNHQEIWDKFVNATTLKEAKAVLDNALISELTSYAKYTIKFNDKFAKFDKNRIIEFELIADSNTSAHKTIPSNSEDKKAWKKAFIKKGAPAELLLDKNTPSLNKNSYDARYEKTLLTFDGIPGKALIGTRIHLNTNIINEDFLNFNKLRTYDPGIRMKDGNLDTFENPISVIDSIFVDQLPLMTNSSTGATESPSNKAANLLEKNDIVKAVLNENKSVVKFKYENLKKGDVVELPYSLYTVETDKDLGKLYPDSESYHLYKPAEKKREDKKVRVEILEDSENVFSFKVLEPIHVGVNQYVWFNMGYLNNNPSTRWKPESWAVKQVLRDNWIDNLNNSKTKLLDMFKPGVAAQSYRTDPTVEFSLIRNGEILKKETPTSKVNLNRNTVVGETTKGTVKVKYVDEAGNEIPNHPTETIAENQPWSNTVTITPKKIDGYAFVKASGPLQTLVGSGEQVITLTYRKLEPVDPNAGKPIVDTIIKEYKPNPKLDPGTQNIIDPGKPRKTQGDKVVDPGKPQVIEVGTKPKVVEEEIPFEKKTRENPNLPEGTSKVVQEGKNGKKKTTITYTLDPKTGKVTPNTPTVETTPPVDQITEIGKGKDKDGDLVVNYIPDPESPQGNETIVDEGSKPKLDVTGKVKDPGKPKVIKVGTKPKVVEEEIPFEKKTRENPNLPEGTSKVVQEGKNGKKKTITTYTLDPKTGKVTPNTPTVETTPPVDQITEIGKGKDKDGDLVVNYIPDPESPEGNETIVDEGSKPKLDVTGKVKDPGKPKVIKVGTKPKVTEEEIPFKETVVENPSKPEGSRTVLKEGKVGKKTTTTTYTLDPKTGKVTPNTTTSTTPPEDRLIEVGTGKNVNGDIVTEYVPDLELEPGQTKVVQNGTPEVKDVTGKVVTPGTPTIIHIGIKPKVVEENVPFEREYKDNPKLPEGVENVIQKGVNGKKVTTTTYTVDTKTGKVTSTDKVDETPVVNEIVERGTGKNITGEIVVNYVPDPELEPGKTKVVQNGTPEVKDVTGKVVTPGKPTIIHVGTKPKVVEEETPFKEETRENKDLPKGQTKVVQEGKVGKKTTTTTYEVDPKTGTVTPTEKVEETPAVNKITEIGTKEEAKPTPTPASQTPAKPQVQEVKKQLPSTGTTTSVALTLAGLSVMGLATTMIRKKKEQ